MRVKVYRMPSGEIGSKALSGVIASGNVRARRRRCRFQHDAAEHAWSYGGAIFCGRMEKLMGLLPFLVGRPWQRIIQK